MDLWPRVGSTWRKCWALEGHCFLPREELLRRAAEILGVEASLVEGCLEEVVREGVVVREAIHPSIETEADAAESARDIASDESGDERSDAIDAIYLVLFHRAEVSLANGLRRLLSVPQDWLPSFGTVDWDVAFGWLHEKTGSALAPEQGEAVRLALTHKVAVFTGGSGCGKSFNIRSIVLLTRAKRAKVLITAPTGRAAKRLAELTGMPGVEASTLQRLLQLRPGEEAAYDREHPLEADRVVVDEASMLDLLLAIILVNAILPGAHLLFVGDVDQLPSVGVGDVLRDLLGLDAAPSVRLHPYLPPGAAQWCRHQRPPHQRRTPPTHAWPGRLLPLR